MTERLFSRTADFRQMIDNGVAIVDEVEALARQLAEKMERIPGTKYKVCVDHECGFILVNQRR